MTSSKLASCESVRDTSQRARPSLDFFCLRWFLSGPLSTQIKVLSSVVDAESLQTPYQTDSTSFHPISACPISDPPVSSITVTADVLNGWAGDWEDAHHNHTHGRGDFATQPDGTGLLMRCCGEDRPGPGPSLTVAASRQEFVTIHDFVMAVHPWLLALEPDIRAAYGVFHSVPLAPEFDILVHPVGLSPLFLLNSKYAHPAALEVERRRVAEVVARKLAEKEKKGDEVEGNGMHHHFVYS
ncbi:hypothetical protein C8A01DRAFT_41457 [Parachaetomium inaequale]|uniref:Uncharacterized protein n=1 Tax=Parachaetomium inaequale TaxID=2588326 RepID=A0AAN6SM21_9PEZI|nr:hypothetical protein C8A01DRAFT_41457 [Parachaetomium inaequale]